MHRRRMPFRRRRLHRPLSEAAVRARTFESRGKAACGLPVCSDDKGLLCWTADRVVCQRRIILSLSMSSDLTCSSAAIIHDLNGLRDLYDLCGPNDGDDGEEPTVSTAVSHEQR